MFAPQLTDDGSFTFFSELFQECFHSRFGAKQEAEQKFVQACRLPQLALERSQLFLLDICYGLGYNSAAALEAIWHMNPDCHITLVALEENPLVPQSAIAHHLLVDWPVTVANSLQRLALEGALTTPQLGAKLLLGDARQTLPSLQIQGFLADAIFLDPFSPPKCPQLWTVEFLTLVAQSLAPSGYLATYSCAAAVRSALQLAGLQIGPSLNVGQRSPGTLANWTGIGLNSLSLAEQEHLQTRAAIPYRDPSLADSAMSIKHRRQQEQASSSLGTSRDWKERWLRKAR
jgi:tRNA U34 5-methylaminomethyl-2-thiouridine-forming methyltransferase MnmC